MYDKSWSVMLAVFLTAGCATSSNEYNPPSPQAVNNEITVNEPFDVVWDRLIKNLSSDFFVINNVEKASRIINVSFNTNNPEQYVDCGSSRRSFQNARGKQEYQYLTAATSHFTLVNPNNNIPYNAYRATKLEGRVNIYVAPTPTGGTTVRANTKYVFGVDVKYTDLAGTPAGNESHNWDFSTVESFRETSPPPGTPAVACSSKGTLEYKILKYVNS